MAVEFRQKSVGEIAKILKRRKWHLLLPMLAFAVAVGWVVWKLPNFYQSTTLLTLTPPKIPNSVINPLSDEDLSQSLQTINQEVLSRSSLEPMIGKYNLFEPEKAAGMDMGLIVDKMRKAIEVKPDKAENEKVVGFRITYHDRTPKAAQFVTAELASKYVNQQISVSTQNVETTRDFIEKQVAESKSALDAYEKQRIDIMTQNSATLPEAGQGLVAQLDGLHKREETIAKDKETLMTERGRLNEAINSNNRQMRFIQDIGEKDTQDAAKQAGQIEDQPAYIQLIRSRADLLAQLDKLLKVYKEKHPDVIAKRDEITRVNDEIENLKKSSVARVQSASQSSSRKTEINRKSLELDNERNLAAIKDIESRMQSKDVEMQQNAAQISALEAKINTIPNVKVALEAINNQYQSAKQKYDDLLKKQNDIQLQLERTSNAQGETIRVVDPANLPQSPMNASKKPMLVAAGAGLGLFLGLLLSSFIEIPRLFKIQNIQDAKHYTGLPVLASVPPLLTRQELNWQKRLHWLKVTAGIVVAFASIPLLIMGLQASRIFDKFIS